MPSDIDTDEDQTRDGSSRAVEWVVATGSTLLVGAMMIYLALQAVSGHDRPPDFAIVAESLDRIDAGTLVKVAVYNRGDVAAAEVLLIASVGAPEGTVERREIIFDHLPAHSVRRGALIFPSISMEGISQDNMTFQIGSYLDL